MVLKNRFMNIFSLIYDREVTSTITGDYRKVRKLTDGQK